MGVVRPSCIVTLLGAAFLATTGTASAVTWPNVLQDFEHGGLSGLLETRKQGVHKDFRTYFRVVALDLLLVHHGARPCESARGDDEENLATTQKAVEVFQSINGMAPNAWRLDSSFWSSLAVPVRPGNSSSAVLALRWLLQAGAEVGRPPLWDAATVENHKCLASFDDSLLATLTASSVAVSCTSNLTQLHDTGLSQECWRALLLQPEVSVSACEVRAPVTVTFGFVWVVAWFVMAVAFAALHLDGKGAGRLSSGTQAWSTALSNSRHSIALLAMILCQNLAAIGIWSFPHDLVKQLLVGLLLSGCALVVVHLAAVRHRHARPVYRAMLEVCLLTMGNVGIGFVILALPWVRGLWLVLSLAIMMVVWGLVTMLFANHNKLIRGVLLFVMCLLAAAGPTLISIASGLVNKTGLWLAAFAPTGLFAASLLSERLVGHFVVMNCEYTAETQWLLATMFRLCIELVRFNTALTVLMLSLVAASGFWFLLLHLAQTFVFEVATRLPRQTGDPPKLNFQQGPPFTAAEIVLQVGAHPWVYRSRALMFPTEVALLLSHLCQLVFVGMPVGVDEGWWIFGISLIGLENICHEAAGHLLDRYCYSVLPTIPWGQLSSHLLALMAGAGMAMSTYAQFGSLWLLYAHHWAACFIDGGQRADDSATASAAGNVARIFWTLVLGITALLVVLYVFLSWLSWNYKAGAGGNSAAELKRLKSQAGTRDLKLAAVLPAEDTDEVVVIDTLSGNSSNSPQHLNFTWNTMSGKGNATSENLVFRSVSSSRGIASEDLIRTISGRSVWRSENLQFSRPEVLPSACSQTWGLTLRELWDDSESSDGRSPSPVPVNLVPPPEGTAPSALPQPEPIGDAHRVLMSSGLLKDMDVAERRTSSPSEDVSRSSLLDEVLADLHDGGAPQTTKEVPLSVQGSAEVEQDDVQVLLQKTLSGDDIDGIMGALASYPEAEQLVPKTRDSAVAREELANAKKTRSRAALEMWVVSGQFAGVPAAELEEAHQVLEQVVREEQAANEVAIRAAARKTAEDDLAAAVQGRSPLVLKKCLAEAQACGLEGSSVSEARRCLAEVLAEEEAAQAAAAEVASQARIRDQLREACESRSLYLLRITLEESKAHGIPESETREAAKILEDLLEAEQQEVAARVLASACEEEDMDEIRSKLQQARDANVEVAAIAAAEDRLQVLVAREAARRQLKEALDSKLHLPTQISWLRSALGNAQAAGLPAAELQAVQEHLTGLEAEERREIAAVNLSEAFAAQDVARTRAAILEARAAGVEESQVAVVEQGLRIYEEELALAHDKVTLLRRRLKIAMESKKSAELATTSTEVEQMLGDSGVAKALRSIIDEAKKMRLVHRSEIQKAEAVLNEVTADLKRILREKKHQEQVLAEEQLNAELEALEKVKPVTQMILDGFQEAINAARIYEANTREAEACLATLQAQHDRDKQQAEDALARALDSVDPAGIKEGLEKCRGLLLVDTVRTAMQQTRGLISSELAAAHREDRHELLLRVPKVEALLALLRHMGDTQLRQFHNELQELKGALRVFCRLRPLNGRERNLGDTIGVQVADSFSVSVQPAAGDPQIFNYDAVFGPNATQTEVFEECRSLIQSAFDGYNVTIFSYGQTGAGKTWTLYGSGQEPGISPRTCEELFRSMARDSERLDFEVMASMVELYCNDLRDLLNKAKDPPKLDFRSVKQPDGSTAVRLEGATEIHVRSSADLAAVVMTGLSQRKVKKTNMNADSSRSHLLLIVCVKVTDRETGRSRNGKITIVDLAGSERLAKSGVSGEGQKEAIEINKSLTALGDVMMAFTSRSKVIPYRNHKLTQLMQDSLGGSAKTLMFVNISPASSNVDETTNALKYASRARCIENDVKRHK